MTAAGRAAISPLGWLMVVLRLSAMLGWLLLCVGLYYFSHLRRGRNRWPRNFLSGIAWIVGVDITTTGTPPQHAACLLANHVSWIDIPALAATSGAAFVAHDGLAGVPLLRWLCEMNETVFVARHDRAGVGEQVARVRAAIARGGVLAIFPEAITSDGSAVLPFRSSLLSALNPLPSEALVQPVRLDYGADIATIAWIGDEHGMANFLRILARMKPIALTVHFLPPLAGAALTNRKTMAMAAHRAIVLAGEQDQRVAL